MQAFQISDSSGVWALNIGAYRLPDPESGTNFEPGIPTQARLTAWMMGQPTLVPCDDPREPARLVEQEDTSLDLDLSGEAAAAEATAAAAEATAAVPEVPAPVAPAPAHKGKHK